MGPEASLTDPAPGRRSPAYRYGMAAVLFAAAVLLRVAVLPPASGFAFISFYPGMVATFFLCGTGAGRAFAVASAIAIFFFVPAQAPGVAPLVGKGVSVLVFLGSAWMIGRLLDRASQATQHWRDAAGALAASERRYLGILQDQTELICRVDAIGRLVYVNEAFCRFIGRPAAALIGEPWQPIAEPEQVAHVQSRLALLQPERPVVSLEARVRDAAGTMAWIHFVNRGLFDADGRLVEIQSVGRDVTVRRDLEERLAHTATEMTDLYDNAPCGYHALAPDGTILNINRRELDWLGLGREDVVGIRKFTDFLGAESVVRFNEAFPRFLASGHVEDIEYDLVGAGGVVRRVSVSANAVRDDRGQVVASRAVAYDISELHAARSELTRLGAEQNVMLDNDLVGIVKFRENQIAWANRGAHRVFGHPGRSLLGRSARVLHVNDASYELEARLAQPTLERGAIYRHQLEMARADGQKLWIDAIGVTLSAAKRESMWIFADVTEMKAYQAQVEHIAFHDPLTGLPNRLLMRDRLDMALASASRSGRQLALCFIDLDGFKPINDRYGHAAGDSILAEIALRLAGCLRASDTVARVGGDEFVVIIDGLAGEAEVHAASERLRAAVALPCFVDGLPPLTVSASIGVALLAPGQDGEALLRAADAAMYEAKRLGKNRIVVAPAPATAPAPAGRRA
jgi:diguanylate cyclase (GGDEF)-like protein/PAS domain S-box-containing protein